MRKNRGVDRPSLFTSTKRSSSLRHGAPRYVIYLTVVPDYRTACISEIYRRLGPELTICAAPSHLDPSVKTGIADDLYEKSSIVRLGQFGYLQWGSWRAALSAEATLLDLNPRSLSAWAILVARKSLGKRTVLWGHLHGRAGRKSKSAPIRRFMRRLADGFVAYTYSSQQEARLELPRQPVWVAPNAIYTQAALDSLSLIPSDRHHAIFVGRFEPEKKVELAVRAFALALQSEPDMMLTLVGAGSQKAELESIVQDLAIADRVQMPGWVNEFGRLEELYSAAFCSLSTGFIGLSLTQSFGFGVPMIASRDEPHSPEVELAASGGVTWFDTDSVEDLATKLVVSYSDRHNVPVQQLHEQVRELYAADRMAQGIVNALINEAE